MSGADVHQLTRQAAQCSDRPRHARPTSRLGRMTAGTPAIQAFLSTSHRTRRSRSPCARRRWRARPARAETRALHPSSSPWRRWRREPSRRARRVSRVLWVFCRRAAPALPDAPTSLEGLRNTRGGPCGRAVAATGSSQRGGARWWPEETAREPSRRTRRRPPPTQRATRGVNLPDARNSAAARGVAGATKNRQTENMAKFSKVINGEATSRPRSCTRGRSRQ